MNISYVTNYDATDIKSWSGTGYYIPKKLTESGHSINYIGDLKNKNYLLEKLKEKSHNFFGKRYYTERNKAVLKGWARQIVPQIPKNTDLLLGPSSQPFSMLDTDVPMTFWTDANFADMVDFYPAYTNMAPSTIKAGHQMEKAALERCKIAVYSSEWAANGAIKAYGISPDKVKVVTYGANIDKAPELVEIKSMLANKSTTKCKLLFLGVHWYRKGADIALEVANSLNKNGLDTELSYVGLETPDDVILPDGVTNYGFISKGTDEGKALLNKLISESHFLILPTRADCTPIVYAEFNAHGVPVLTTDVGGIPTLVKDNINGMKFSLNDSAEAYANYIMNIFAEYNKYKELSLSAYNEYVTRLNWDSAISEFNNLLKETF